MLRIFYPQDNFNADGSLLKDVILERQTPLQILGSDVPGSSGTAYNGIVVNASYPGHYTRRDRSGAPAGTFDTYRIPGVSSYWYPAYNDPGVLDPNASSATIWPRRASSGR